MDFGMNVNGAVFTPPRLSESSWAAAWSSWMLHRSVEGGKGSHSHKDAHPNCLLLRREAQKSEADAKGQLPYGKGSVGLD